MIHLPTGTWGRVLWLAVAVAVVLAFGWVFKHLHEVIIMLSVAGLLAFILDPLVTRMSRRMPRVLAIIIAYVGLLAVLTVAILLVVPAIIEQLGHLHRAWVDGDIKEQLAGVTGQLSEWYDRIPDPVKNQLTQLQGTLEEAGKAWVQTFLQAFVGVLGWIAKGMIILVLSIYLILDKRAIRDFLLSLVPMRMRVDAVHIVGEVLEVIRAYLRGQIVVIAFVAIAVTLLLFVMGIPYALTIGTMAGILEVIPYFGAVAGAVPAVLLALFLKGWVVAGFLVMFFIVINQVEGHVVIPLVMGRELEMRPIVVLLSLLVGAELYGIVGLIVAVPVCRIVQVLIEHGRRLHRESQARSTVVVLPEPEPMGASSE